jgi:hypothetical protein
MKFATASKSVVLELALLLASTAYAETKVSLQLSDPVLLNGNKLKPGDYELEWGGSGPNVELSIMRGKTVVAKVPARVVVLDTPAASDAALTLKNDSGPNSLTGFQFRGGNLPWSWVEPATRCRQVRASKCGTLHGTPSKETNAMKSADGHLEFASEAINCLRGYSQCLQK